jgi:signal peptidase II
MENEQIQGVEGVKRTRIINIGALVLVAAVLATIDQIVKHWAYTYLRPVGQQPLLDGLLGFTYVENRGAAFGILENGRWFFIPLTVIILAAVIYYYIRLPLDRFFWIARVPLIFICGGAVGNFIDRLFNGYVVDMFEFKFITFPIFNVADMCLVSGTFVLFFVLFFIVKDKA